MNLPVRIGMDTAKSVFQIHGVDQDEAVVVRRQLRRADMIRYFERLPPVLVAIESCGSSHHWARLLRSFGHDVKLIPPQYVKPYVKRGKNDASDAEALCEAVTRPSMRFVPVKSKERQAACMLMTVRERLVMVKSQLSNAFRSYAAEFGIVGPAGRQNVGALMKRVLEDESLPEMARELFSFQAREFAAVEARLEEIDTKLLKWHRGDDISQRLSTIPGVGPIGSAMLSMKAPPPEMFKSGRDFAAWIGLTPKGSIEPSQADAVARCAARAKGTKASCGSLGQQICPDRLAPNGIWWSLHQAGDRRAGLTKDRRRRARLLENTHGGARAGAGRKGGPTGRSRACRKQ